MSILHRGLIALVMALCAGIASAGTAFQDPLDTPAQISSKAQHSLLIGVTQTPGGRWVAVGRRGHILYSDDTQSWQQAEVPVSVDLVAVQFPTANDGWAVGHGGIILHSTDAGRTWRKQLDGRQLADLLIQHWQPLAARASEEDDSSATFALQDAKRFKEEGPGRPFLDVQFVDEQVGYVTGAYNLLLRTEDAGRHWSVLSDRTDNPSAFHLNALRLLDGRAYLVGEQGLLLREDTASQRFASVPTPYNGTWFGLLVRTDLLLLFGLRGTAYLSHDQGQSWIKATTGIDSTLTGGTLLPDGRIALVGAGGEMLVSEDATGERFRPSPQPSRQPLYGVAAASGSSAVVTVGAGGVQRFDLPPSTHQTNR